MEEIADNVYIDSHYPGVTLGAISMPRGLIQVDAPPSLDDGRAWRAALLNLGGGPERLLINLDAHPDRTLGARAMDCTVITQEKTAQVFRNRPSTFKAQGDETGAEWEQIPNLGSVRWTPPEISFTKSMTLHWGDTPVILEHHPGPTAGSAWVILPEEKVVFVGDAVLKNQPPFLAQANLDAWIEALQLLESNTHKNYTIVSGRDGAVSASVVHSQLKYIKDIQKQVNKLISKNASADALEKLIPTLLSSLKFPAARQKQYAQRLRYGLQQYYARNAHHANVDSEEK
jgi:glyoxylase-like metal-dependent hydrolase (beta-lactamase superfamily II)